MGRKQSWKEKVEAEVIAPIERALEAEGIRPLAVYFDFKNCDIRVVIPEGTGREELKRIKAICQAPPGIYVVAQPPTSYPFSNHLNGPIRKMKTYELKDPIKKIKIQIDHLNELNTVYGRLESMTAEFDKVATFALGGLVPMIHLSQRLSGKAPLSDEARQAAKAKYHLFPGLLWGNGGTSRRLFAEWLRGLDYDTSLLIFDTSFSGGGINRIRRCLQMYSRKGCGTLPRTIRIVGIIDSGRLGAKTLTPYTVDLANEAGNGCRLEVEYLMVPSLLAEDVSELIGYASLRELGSMEGLWSAAILYLTGAEQRICGMCGTRGLSTTFYELLLDPPQPQVLDQIDIWMQEQGAIFIAVTETIKSEADQLRRAYRQKLIDEATFDDEYRKLPAIEMGAKKRAQEGLKSP